LLDHVRNRSRKKLLRKERQSVRLSPRRVRGRGGEKKIVPKGERQTNEEEERDKREKKKKIVDLLRRELDSDKRRAHRQRKTKIEKVLGKESTPLRCKSKGAHERERVQNEAA